jgi:hypothetical protein
VASQRSGPSHHLAPIAQTQTFSPCQLHTQVHRYVFDLPKGQAPQSEPFQAARLVHSWCFHRLWICHAIFQRQRACSWLQRLAWRKVLRTLVCHFSNTLCGTALRSKAPPIEWHLQQLSPIHALLTVSGRVILCLLQFLRWRTRTLMLVKLHATNRPLFTS